MGSGAVVHITYLTGNCPVQGEGTIDGQPFYFRARGDVWSLGIGEDPVSNPEWMHMEFYGEWPDAGWMEEEEAIGFIMMAAQRFHHGQPGLSLDDGELERRLREAQARLEGGRR